MSEHVSLRLPAALRSRLDRIAKAGGTNRSHVITLAIEGACGPDARKLRTLNLWREDAEKRGCRRKP